MKSASNLFVVAVLFVGLFAVGSGVRYEPGPYDSTQDTLGIASGASITRAFHIKGAQRVGLYVPAIDATDITLLASFDIDSTFVQVAKEAAAGDTLKKWTLHNGTGSFAIDITQWVSGFDYFKVDTGDTMTVLRTFHVQTKW